MLKLKTKQNNAVQVRPPVVVVLGHVDHGKSSLLEAIREDFRIISKESGGITQRMGAYVAEFEGKLVTFIDTPGHEAFSAVRSRGARVADIGVLVVAADEGVKPQTKEAIDQARQAGIPFVVALHKIDKPEANPDRVKQQLAEAGVFVEGYGGDVPVQTTSAVSKAGIKELLEMILLMAELEELKADGAGPGAGVVIESFLDQRRGSAVTLLVRQGTLEVGDIVGTTSAWGKVRILEDFKGDPLPKALPSTPCLVIGFQDSPGVGEEFQVLLTEDEAQSNLAPVTRREPPSVVSKDLPTLDIILKVDVAGSLEVVESVLLAIPQDKVALRFVQEGVGEITENDVKAALGTKARIIGFRAAPNQDAKDLAHRERVPLETFDVIYHLVERVRALMERNIEPEHVKVELGAMNVLAVFLTDKDRQIVGGKVLLGEIRKGSKLEVFRNDEQVGQGKIVNLQKNKKDVGKVVAGEECGLQVEGSERIKEGDILKAFAQEIKEPMLGLGQDSGPRRF